MAPGVSRGNPVSAAFALAPICLVIGAAGGYVYGHYWQPQSLMTVSGGEGRGTRGGARGDEAMGARGGAGRSMPPGGGSHGGGPRRSLDQELAETHPETSALLGLVRRLAALEAGSQHRLTRAQADQLQPLVSELLAGREVDEAACKQYREKFEGLLTPDQSNALSEALNPQRGRGGERQPFEPDSPFTGRARGHLAQLLGFLSVKQD